MFLKNDLNPNQAHTPDINKLINAENNQYSDVYFFKENLQYTNDSGVSDFKSPVNNFLKDRIDINQEFRQGKIMKHDFSICLNGKMVPANEVLRMNMEENY
jgi:hypothetical protein